jgi:hypothetical protein
LRSSLHGLALLLGELVLEPFLFGDRHLTDLLELSLRVEDLLLLVRCNFQQVGPALGPLCQGLSQYNKVVSSISTRHLQEKTHRRQLTISAVLMVTMLVRKACISSLSSKISSFHGVQFQLIFQRDSLGLEDGD